MSRLPDLEAWAIFAKVAETGSFARAANELSLSQATVSKAISRLEARTKTVLFHRTSRRMSLTESGEFALDRATRILDEGEAVEAAIAEHSTSLQGLIRVSAPMSFGIVHLAPMLPEFMATYPDVTLDVQFNDEMVDLIGSRFDLALRISSLESSSLLARRLCPVSVLLVGAPAYFERHGRPEHPRELANHRTLQYSNSCSGENWRFHHARHGEFTQAVRAQLHANNADALMPALLAGRGLALQAEFLVWEELQKGRLEVVMQDWQAEPVALHIVTPPGRRRPARVQALISYLAERMAKQPWAQKNENDSRL
ncbi:LysR family transcriptional regulator [Ensifer adhaerens]|uniref:LysR family transcriptional regulator n=1 Tax=Ensifer adhaerens TaxID=106592 RepID=UPI001CBD2221|nr:LysR family transcriptional regulator [Ensifer adhaerens]MBZ7924772.1 LysR family transcriptional regulator [Ensifer adhaerens]UAX96005.1 LysR family transcriptional regulator [Ensifer adhaerens]UAY04654.1 LysR family transcriptional regulator [Ensifer adhaerens]UAY10085.1 LysR family transcriptional regulator [Ensifer adhaerens]